MSEEMVSRHKAETKTKKRDRVTAVSIGAVSAILFLVLGGMGSYTLMKDRQAKHITNRVKESVSIDLDRYLTAYDDELANIRSDINGGVVERLSSDEKDKLSYNVEHVVTNDLVKHVQRNKEDTLNQMENDIARIIRANMQRLTEEEQDRLIKEVSTIVEAELYQTMLDFFASQKDLTALDARVTKNTTDILNLKNSTEDNFSETHSQISEIKNALDAIKQESNKTNQDTNSAFDNLKTNINNIIAAYREAFSKDMGSMHDEMDKEFAEDQASLENLTTSLRDERKERIGSDGSLSEMIDNEKKDRTDADRSLNKSLEDEMKERTDADNTLSKALEDEMKDRTDADNALTKSLEDEKKDRINADNKLSKSLEDEKKAREEADKNLSKSLEDEKKAREEADKNLSKALEEEKEARTAECAELDNRLDGYDERIGTNRIWSGTRSEYKKKKKTPKTISFISED